MLVELKPEKPSPWIFFKLKHRQSVRLEPSFTLTFSTSSPTSSHTWQFLIWQSSSDAERHISYDADPRFMPMDPGRLARTDTVRHKSMGVHVIYNWKYLGRLKKRPVYVPDLVDTDETTVAAAGHPRLGDDSVSDPSNGRWRF